MIVLYRLLFLPLFLLAAPYYAWRMIRRGGYARDFFHRLGGHKKLPERAEGKKRVWIQAVSVGEVEALSALVDKLLSAGNVELILTTTTSTGYEILRNKYADKAFYVGVFPFDFYFFSRRTWDNFRPDLAVLMEGELWPEHLHQARVRGIPVALINARMSDRSFRRYLRAPFIARRILGDIAIIAASNTSDMERFVGLGADRGKIFCAGNMKFDVPSEGELSDEDRRAMKREMGFEEDSLVLLGSSTWEGEESMLLDVLGRIRALGADCRLLLVPRHAERRAHVEKTIGAISHHLRSRGKRAPDGTLVYLADTTGELRTLTKLADFAFVGKSLPPNNGGQSPLDCARSGVAMVYGPNMSNFRDICRNLEDCRAAVRVEDYGQAKSELVRLAKSADLRAQIGEAAKSWYASNVGATERCFRALNKLMGI